MSTKNFTTTTAGHETTGSQQQVGARSMAGRWHQTSFRSKTSNIGFSYGIFSSYYVILSRLFVSPRRSSISSRQTWATTLRLCLTRSIQSAPANRLTFIPICAFVPPRYDNRSSEFAFCPVHLPVWMDLVVLVALFEIFHHVIRFNSSAC